MKEENLLEKAKKIKPRSKIYTEITDEHIELGIAWLKGEIGYSQICGALGVNKNSGNVLYTIAIFLREGYKRGKLTSTNN